MPMKKDNTYQSCLKTMYGFRRFGIKLGLSTISRILKGLGNPQNRYACIHIAGTNGKGSVASTLSSILQKTGHSVGLYTSPHLVRFNERISINGDPVTDKDVVTAYHAVKSVHHGNRAPTFFEFATAMALYEFYRRKVDWAVIETGMGGRLDATNVIRPAACVITNISVEHKEYLGNTISEIAFEKGGIIKPGVPVVTGARQKSAVSVLEEIAEENGARLLRRGKNFKYRSNGDGSFNYYGRRHVWRDLQPGLVGGHQIENAALSVAVCEELNTVKKAEIPLAAIRKGLAEARWPGRLEIVSRSPFVILDGAHNLAAARRLAEFLKTELRERDIVLVIGILDDKPHTAMLNSLLSAIKRVVLTRPKIDRALEPDALFAATRNRVKDVTIIPEVEQAVRYALESAGDKEAICVAGSLYVVGEAKEALEKILPATAFESS